jgi:AraC family transcriptional regulator
MNPLAQMNQAMEYLETNLTNEIDFERMAQIAGCSEYHFRRMFSYLAEMPLGEYVRRRRLALAVSMLHKPLACIHATMRRNGSSSIK